MTENKENKNIFSKNLDFKFNPSNKLMLNNINDWRKIPLRRTKKDINFTRISRASSIGSSVKLESVQVTLREEDKVVKKFKPSVFARAILEKIIPDKPKKNRLTKLNNSVSGIKRSENKSLSKVIEENDDMITALNEKFVQRIHSAKIQNRIKELAKESNTCNHQFENPFIEQFLTPLNKFISKDFKVDFTPLIEKINMKIPRQKTQMNEYIQKINRNSPHLPPILKKKKVK